jgi:hypothetical protein
VIRRLGLILVSIALAAACTSGGDGPSATDPPATTTTVPPTTTITVLSDVAVEEFRACLAEKGIEIEEIPLDAAGHPRLDMVMVTLDFSDPATAEAVSTCSELLETGALDLGGDEVLREQVLEQLQGFSRCMVDLGVEDFPDPVPGFIGIGSPFPVAEIPYSDPGFAAAVAICRESLLETLPGSSEG